MPTERKTVMVAGPRPKGLRSSAFKVSLAIDSYFAALEQKVRVIHGSAEGVDSMCAAAAARNGHDVVPYEVNELDREIAARRGAPRKAPLYRTIRMLESDRPDMVVAWWDGESSGTGFTIAQARRRNIPVVIFNIKEMS